MDEFFRQDALDYTHFLMGKSYCFRLKDDLTTIVACFTVSNDSIRIYDLPSSRRNAMWKITNREKMLTRYPGVLIGRLAVAEEFGGKGIGSAVLRFIKMWFLDEDNKTGCRFAIVDAKNEPEVLRFYEKNNFVSLFPHEIDEDLYTKPPKDDAERTERIEHPRKLRTRLMFCDLLED
jgi:GNAT superfamily N-acetyltransferase